MTESKMGTNTFLRSIGASAPTMRLLEARGVISPSKSDSGWRQFSAEDVTAARAFLAQQLAARRERQKAQAKPQKPARRA